MPKREAGTNMIKPDETPIARFSELLDLPPEIVLAYCKPRTRVTSKDVRLFTMPVHAEPAGKLCTVKEHAVLEVAERADTSSGDENELHKRWRDASEEQKPQLEEQLFNELVKHSKAVIWQMLGESSYDLHN